MSNPVTAPRALRPTPLITLVRPSPLTEKPSTFGVSVMTERLSHARVKTSLVGSACKVTPASMCSESPDAGTSSLSIT